MSLCLNQREVTQVTEIINDGGKIRTRSPNSKDSTFKTCNFIVSRDRDPETLILFNNESFIKIDNRI